MSQAEIQAAEDAKETAKDATTSKLRAIKEYYDKVGGYEKKKARIEQYLRKYEAKTIAAVLGISAKQALKELNAAARREKLEEAGRAAESGTVVAAAKLGLVGFQASWGQIATGAKRVDEQQLAKLTKIENELRQIREQGKPGLSGTATPRY